MQRSAATQARYLEVNCWLRWSFQPNDFVPRSTVGTMELYGWRNSLSHLHSDHCYSESAGPVRTRPRSRLRLRRVARQDGVLQEGERSLGHTSPAERAISAKLKANGRAPAYRSMPERRVRLDVPTLVNLTYCGGTSASGVNDPRPSFSISRMTCTLLASVAATPR
jgi:hypothetical protein